MKQADYATAAGQMERALVLAPRVFGESHDFNGALMNNLAIQYKAMGQYTKVEPLYQRSLKFYEKKYGPECAEVAEEVNNLAVFYMTMGQYGESERYYKRCLAIQEAKLASDDLKIATTCNNLGSLMRKVGRYSEAEPLLLRSLNIRTDKLGADHPNVATTMSNLGNLYSAMGQYERAEPIFKRSLEIRRASLGPDHPDVADSLQDLGVLYVDLQKYSDAEHSYLDCLKIREAKFGPENPEVAVILISLGGTYSYEGKYELAESTLKRALEIYQKKFGPDHPSVADTLNNLAVLYKTQGNYAKAEPLFRESLRIYEAKRGPLSEDVSSTVRNLAVLHAALNQTEIAASEIDRERRITRKYIAQVLPLLDENEQLRFLFNKDRMPIYVALTLGWENGSDAAIAGRSANWLANSKAVAQQTVAQRTALIRDAKDPKLRIIIAQLSDIRARLGKLTNGALPDGQEQAVRDEIQHLSEQEQVLAKQLRQTGDTTAADAWVESDDIRGNIPHDAILVDLYRFMPVKFKRQQREDQWHPSHYVAWLTPATGQGDPRAVDLGDAQEIDAAIAVYQEAFRPLQSTDKTINPISKLGEAEAEKQIREALAAIGKRVLEPLMQQLKDKQEILLSPDASLWLAPWGALPEPGDEEKYAIEKWNIHYLTSARDLAREHRQASTNPPRIFANPNYDLAVQEMPFALASVFGNAKLTPLARRPDASMLAMRGQLSGAIGRVPRLPGTASEAEAITPNLQKLCRADVKLYADQTALEGVFKHLRAPRVLVLSTHGYFMPDQARDGEKSGPANENPLLRCGLLLAGCNNRDKIPANSDLDDGVLTGMEIVGTDLRNTELVVLSACETGLGKVNTYNGEGVSGLRQAFQLAGAQSVVATLWQIPDQATAQLMSDFFANLAAGQSKSDALRNAQLKTIKARREKYGAAHPLFWAAFTLTGL